MALGLAGRRAPPSSASSGAWIPPNPKRCPRTGPQADAPKPGLHASWFRVEPAGPGCVWPSVGHILVGDSKAPERQRHSSGSTQSVIHSRTSQFWNEATVRPEHAAPTCCDVPSRARPPPCGVQRRGWTVSSPAPCPPRPPKLRAPGPCVSDFIGIIL